MVQVATGHSPLRGFPRIGEVSRMPIIPVAPLGGEVQFSLGKGQFSLDTCISDVSYHVSKPLAPNTFRIHARYVSRHDTLQDTLEYVHSERFGTPKFGIHCDTVGYVWDT